MKLSVSPDLAAGRIKPMNAVNNGPFYTENGDQNATNLPAYRAARIPFARTHDAAICYSYGGSHIVDVVNIFPDFDADPEDPAAYDFTLTDEYLRHIAMAGTEVFYRLGNAIEHWSKHYGILPPKDFHKWAVICEHIIRHYNEGWADGLHLNIRYWEIWNEPDLEGKCWGDTAAEFYDLFVAAAKHLKACFPDLHIGGPAVCGYNEKWLRPFFERLRAEQVPLDFYSWHIYTAKPEEMSRNARKHRTLLDEYGFTATESILDEWNYVRSFCDEAWIYSLNQERSIKGAAFLAAAMTECQSAPVEMLMYYDARIGSGMNGMFDDCGYRTRKGYWPIRIWGELLEMGTACRVSCDVPDIRAAAAVKDGTVVTMVSYFTDDDDALPREFRVELPGDVMRTLYLLDETHDLAPVKTVAPDGGFWLTMQPNTVVVIR